MVTDDSRLRNMKEKKTLQRVARTQRKMNSSRVTADGGKTTSLRRLKTRAWPEARRAGDPMIPFEFPLNFPASPSSLSSKLLPYYCSSFQMLPGHQILLCAPDDAPLRSQRCRMNLHAKTSSEFSNMYPADSDLRDREACCVGLGALRWQGYLS